MYRQCTGNMFKKGMGYLMVAIFIAICLQVMLSACSNDNTQNDEIDGKWEEREKAFQSLLKDTRMNAVDFNREQRPAPELKLEKSDEAIMEEPVRNWVLGVMSPETGELSDYGRKTLNGVHLALDEVNRGGGVKGHAIQLFHKDTRSTVSGAVAAAEAMIQENVMAIIGSPTGEVTFSATKPLNDSRTILFSAGTRRRIGDTGIYHFRNTLADNEAISEVVRFCIEEKGYKDFAIFSSMVNDFSIEISAFFKSSLMLQGGRLVQELFLWPETTTYVTEEQSSIRAQILKFKTGKKPDALIFTGDLEEGLKVLKIMKEEGVAIPVISGEDLVEDNFLREAGKLSEGMISFSGFNPDDPESHIRKFVGLYKKKYKEKPDRIAALAYDAVKIVLEAAENTPSLRSGFLAKEILKIKDYRGVTGLTTFKESGEVVKHPVIYEVKEKEGQLAFLAKTSYR